MRCLLRISVAYTVHDRTGPACAHSDYTLLVVELYPELTRIMCELVVGSMYYCEYSILKYSGVIYCCTKNR